MIGVFQHRLDRARHQRRRQPIAGKRLDSPYSASQRQTSNNILLSALHQPLPPLSSYCTVRNDYKINKSKQRTSLPGKRRIAVSVARDRRIIAFWLKLDALFRARRNSRHLKSQQLQSTELLVRVVVSKSTNGLWKVSTRFRLDGTMDGRVLSPCWAVRPSRTRRDSSHIQKNVLTWHFKVVRVEIE